MPRTSSRSTASESRLCRSRPRRWTKSNKGFLCSRYMPSMVCCWPSSAAPISSVVKCAAMRITPLPSRWAFCRCSRPSTWASFARRSRDHHQLIAISKKAMPVEAKFSLSRRLRSAADFSGKHNSRLRRAMVRRSLATRYINAPKTRPMVSSAGYGSCTISHKSPRPHQSGQKRGARYAFRKRGRSIKASVNTVAAHSTSFDPACGSRAFSL